MHLGLQTSGPCVCEGTTALADRDPQNEAKKSGGDHISLYSFSSSSPLHCRAHCVPALSPAARTVIIHQMFVITNLAERTTSRAELMKYT